jgi:hypothetical protein
MIHPKTAQKGRTVTRTNFMLKDEFNASIFSPRGIPPPASDAICRVLNHPAIRADFRRAVRAVIRRWPALEKVRVVVTQ